MEGCLFCKIIAGEIPCEKVYEDDLCLAFRDIDPKAPTHLLLIPKKHIPSLASVSAEDSRVIAHLMEVIAALSKTLSLSSGFRVVANSGADGGQTVFHLHFHILAGRVFAWPPG